MQNIDFDKFYADFDLSVFLTKPVGRFDREAMRDILNVCENPKGIAFMAGFYGIRQAMIDRLAKVKDVPEWQNKISLLREDEAQEIYCRIWLAEKIKVDYHLLKKS